MKRKNRPIALFAAVGFTLLLVISDSATLLAAPRYVITEIFHQRTCNAGYVGLCCKMEHFRITAGQNNYLICTRIIIGADQRGACYITRAWQFNLGPNPDWSAAELQCQGYCSGTGLQTCQAATSSTGSTLGEEFSDELFLPEAGAEGELPFSEMSVPE